MVGRAMPHPTFTIPSFPRGVGELAPDISGQTEASTLYIGELPPIIIKDNISESLIEKKTVQHMIFHSTSTVPSPPLVLLVWSV
ncbi:hypothetical protein KIN20_036019 [Parelaphostrongylus tenuis]|uniref:Uncharacterized protein n=1 Tax=Parelaphostrongylus tenuis TaxID=148309 RepID=A0AAD5RCM9_PARTN|nr:hypothetical protein KIN20_036019 [Parelaphostrongylus tenuis]